MSVSYQGGIYKEASMRSLTVLPFIIGMLCTSCFAKVHDSEPSEDSEAATSDPAAPDPGEAPSSILAPDHSPGGFRSSSDAGAVGAGDADGSSLLDPRGGSVDLEMGDGDLTVLLVFDKSGSMAQTWDGRGLWQIASDTLLAGMEGVLDSLTIGAILFPQPGDCAVMPLEHETQIQLTSGRKFVERWNATVAVDTPRGGTPMGLAFELADRAIEQAGELGLLEQRFRVLVVTDGEPNCGTNPESLVSYAARWRELGVETHVLGLPGSEAAASLLDRIASGGGTASYIAPGNSEELEETFYRAVR